MKSNRLWRQFSAQPVLIVAGKEVEYKFNTQQIHNLHKLLSSMSDS